MTGSEGVPAYQARPPHDQRVWPRYKRASDTIAFGSWRVLGDPHATPSWTVAWWSFIEGRGDCLMWATSHPRSGCCVATAGAAVVLT
jgi:hypothetical protein